MPAFYRPWYRRRQQRWRQRRRRPLWTWRPRRTIQRRWRRRRWVRRKFYGKKKSKKLKKLFLKFWQPHNIRKCHIKGWLCLFACGKQRTNHNYILTCNSYVPESEPGGGAWSILQFTLRVLWDEYTHFRNWWTTSNQGLPLCRYIRCVCKFYRTEETAYIVTPSTCPPFDVSLDSYLNTQPSRHIMNRHSFIVPKLRPNSKKKFIKKCFYPPAMFQNKWYFQQEILNQPLLMLTTSAISFNEMFAPNDQINTNISFISLNTTIFQNNKWENGDTPYQCKVSGTLDIYLYTSDNGTKITTWQQLIPLFETEKYQLGKKITNVEDLNNRQNWGNPFTERYNHKDVRIYYGTKPNTLENPPNITEITELFHQCRYNPFRDKGIGNKVYLKSTKTTQGSFLTLPTDDRLIVQDMPLWLIFWGWTDWLLKSKPVYHLNDDYQVVFQSPYVEPALPCYVLADRYFNSPNQTHLNETDKAHWHIKTEYQEYSIETIAQSGPGTPKIHPHKQIQAHVLYNFFFKWGGCPAPMEIIADPAKQEKFPTPNNILQRLTIQDPETPKEYFLYKFDEKSGEITDEFVNRTKQDYASQYYFTDYGTKDPPLLLQTQAKEDQAPLQKETEKDTQQEQLNLLKQQQRHMLHRIKQLLKTPKYFPLQ
nr:MAG: ORF1 [TTV-like mini virus]